MNKISLNIGSTVYFENKSYVISKHISAKELLAKESEFPYEFKVLKIVTLKANYDNKQELDIGLVDDKSWEIAKKRYQTIESLLVSHKTTQADYKKVAEVSKISVPTLYRWVSSYSRTGTLSSLLPNYKDRGGANKSRLSSEDEKIIESVIEDKFLNPQKYSVTVIYRDIVEKFTNAKMKVPHINTIRARIQKLDPKLVTKKRDLEKVNDTRGMPERNPRGKFPLELIQIDHTPLDIILVDEEDRKEIGRAYITLALDIFSRMVAGFYISHEPPSFFNTGQCILNMIMTKDDFLKYLGVEGEWPLYGIPREISLDNAKEFRGIDITRFCEQYSIEIDWRPVGRSHYGGHVERFFKTLGDEIHTLPGTTFSNITQKGKYDSQAKAVMSIGELEKWITEYVVNIYNKKEHSSIGMTPEEKYMEGIFGIGNYPGTGLPPIVENTKSLRLSLLPSVERTVQKNGITIDHVTYYSEVLRKWIYPQNSRTKARSKLFICKRDPRDISKIYFYDPDIKEYFEIPYRNITNPKINLPELRKTIAKIKEDQGNTSSLDEYQLFDTYKKMKAIEESSAVKTKKARRDESSKKYLHKKLKTEVPKKLNNSFPKIKKQKEKSPEPRSIEVPKLFNFDFIEED